MAKRKPKTERRVSPALKAPEKPRDRGPIDRYPMDKRDPPMDCKVCGQRAKFMVRVNGHFWHPRCSAHKKDGQECGQ